METSRGRSFRVAATLRPRCSAETSRDARIVRDDERRLKKRDRRRRDLFKSHDPYGTKALRLEKSSVFAADEEAEDADAAPASSADAAPPPADSSSAFLTWADAPRTAAGPSSIRWPPKSAMTDALRDAGTVAGVLSFLGFRDVGRLHLLSTKTRDALESDDAAPATWHAACAALGFERGLFVPRFPAPAPGAEAAGASEAAGMAWKRLFFNQLWPARRKWTGTGKEKRDFKIEVAVRFRPEAEDLADDDGPPTKKTAARQDVVLPLHQRATRASIRSLATPR